MQTVLEKENWFQIGFTPPKNWPCRILGDEEGLGKYIDYHSYWSLSSNFMNVL